MRLLLLPLLALAACATAEEPLTTPPPEHPLSWMSGCWMSEDGSSREVWSEPEQGHLFGHAVTYGEGGLGFFEMTHIAPGDLYMFDAYPRGKGPTRFVESMQGNLSVTFVNEQNDYPELISYARDGKNLTAYIALADGSKRGDYAFVPCAD